MVRYHFKDRYQTVAEVLQALQPLVNRQESNTGVVVPRLWQTKKFQMLMGIGASAAIAVSSLNFSIFQPPNPKIDTNSEQISTQNVQEQYVENRHATTGATPSPSPVLSPPSARQLTEQQLQEMAIIATDESDLDKSNRAKAIAPPIPAAARIPQKAQNKVKSEISLPSRNTATRPAARAISNHSQRRTTQLPNSSSAKPRKLTVRQSNSSTPKQFQRHTSRRTTSRPSSAWQVEVR